MRSKSIIPAKLIGVFLLAGTILVVGCQSKPTLMPTPNLYTWPNFNPFADVPPELQNNHVDVLYLTDRAREGTTKAGIEYGYKRSRSDGAGSATTRKTRGLTRSVMARIVPPFPAPSRPSNTTMIRAPVCLTHS